MAGSETPNIIGYDCFYTMVIMNINHPEDPIGLFVQQIFTDAPGRDSKLNECQRQANQAIKLFLDKPASSDNCARLREYMQGFLAQANLRPDSEMKTELVTMITNIIDTLSTGIKPGSTSTEPKKQGDPRSYTAIERQAYERWRIWGWENRPIVTNPNTLEGYIRRLPGVANMNYHEFIQKYGKDVIMKFFPPKPGCVDFDALLNHTYECDKKIAPKFVYVKLTMNQPKKMVIEDRFDNSEEIYQTVQELGMETPVVVIETGNESAVAAAV